MKNLYLILIVLTLNILDVAGQWTPDTYTTESFTGMQFINNTTGFIFGTGNHLSISTNSGNNWVLISTAGTQILYDLQNFNISTILITGTQIGMHSYGLFRKSTDGGITWNINSQVTPLNNTLVTMNFPNSETGYLAGTSCCIWKTTNAGENWSYISFIQNFNVNKIYFVNELTGYILGDIQTEGRIYKTTNSGISWLLQLSTSAMNDIVFVNENEGIAVGMKVIHKTTNGGINWIPVNLNFPLNYTFYFIKKITTNIIYIGGAEGIIAKSINSGNSFYKQISNTNKTITDAYFFNDTTGIAVGWHGLILRTTNGGGPVSVNQISQNIPGEFHLSQNYPNPFNPVTNIEFSIPRISFVNITIYNVTGIEIASLVNEELRPGEYKTAWDASKHPSSVYYYRLSAGEFYETKKMVLLK